MAQYYPAAIDRRPAVPGTREMVNDESSEIASHAHAGQRHE
jgi:hypothetical protein